MANEVNILLVDDKPARLLSYEAALDCLGHNLVRAYSGTEALKWLMQKEFAAILLDVSMPEMDGFETATLIRNHPRFEETPIIFVTGVHLTDIDQRKGYEMGAVDYVQIPVIPEILRGKVQALVQLYRQRVELSLLNKKLVAANTELAKAHEELKAENTRELQQLNKTLENANRELVAANAKLVEEIAERERVEQALNQSAKRKDEYIAILAHELRNPLSAIHNAAQVMQLENSSEQQFNWARDLLHRQVKHLTCLMDDLLDISRISNGRIQLRRESTDLATIVTHAAETVSALLDEHDHKLQLELPEEQLFVDGDPVRLNQVLGNLLTNAAKYMEDGGLIQLTLETDGEGWAIVKVRDHGMGISDDLLGTVFDLFVQAPTAINRAKGGLGIGLALVRALVELHGGTTNVSSDGPGCGAEFSVRLPLINAKPQLPEITKVRETSAKNLLILIIDDNCDSADGLAICLESEGYRVRVNYNGEDGIATAVDCVPDVVLLDITLPDISGYEVAKRLRQHEQLASLSIIAMSGHSSKSDKQKAVTAGFNFYLVKPVDYSELLTLLSNRELKQTKTA